MIKNKLKIILIILLITACFSSCAKSSSDGQSDSDYIFEPRVLSADELAMTGSRDEDMQLTGESKTLRLYVNTVSGEFRIESADGSAKWYSNPVSWTADTVASAPTKDLLGSQVLIEYYDPERLKHSYSSYADSFKHGQLQITAIDNGVRVDYLMGLARKKLYCPEILRGEIYDQVSALLPDEDSRTLYKRYRYFDITQTDEKTISELEAEYPDIRSFTEVYILRSLGLNIRKEIGAQFDLIEWGQEEFEIERELFGYPGNTTSNAVFLVPVEYRLEDDTFVAEIISDEIKGPKGYVIAKIDLLPYFASEDNTAEGYMLLPDGSGALIDLNASAKYGYAYSQPIYGKDFAITQVLENNSLMQVYLPVFGVSSENGAVLAVVESAEANGLINANLGGEISSQNNVWASFSPTAMDYLSYDGLMSVDGTYVFANSSVRDRFRVRYSFIDSLSPDFVDLAVLYRNRLIGQEVIREQSSGNRTPFYLDLVGSVDKRETFLGIPYNDHKALTTFAQARLIIEELVGGSVKDIIVRYKGWANNGMNNTLSDSAKPLSVLGGYREYDSFVDFCESNDVSVYLDSEMSFVRENTLFDGFTPFRNASRLITRKVASRNEVLKSTGKKMADDPFYVLNAHTQSRIIKAFMEDDHINEYAGLSFASLGSVLSGDYKYSDNITRSDSVRMISSALEESRASEKGIILDGGNAYTLKYAAGLLDIPVVSSKMLMASKEVPFFSVVLSGCIPYAGSPLNLSGDWTSAVLDSARIGSGLHFQWIYDDNDALFDTGLSDLYSMNYKIWVREAAELAVSYQSEMSAVSGRQIVAYMQISDGVYRTTFEGGHNVYVNYNFTTEEADGIQLPARSYKVIEGE